MEWLPAKVVLAMCRAGSCHCPLGHRPARPLPLHHLSQGHPCPAAQSYLSPWAPGTFWTVTTMVVTVWPPGYLVLLLRSCADVFTGPWQRAQGTLKGPKWRCGETQVQPFLTTRCSSLSWYPGAGAETPASSAPGRFASLKLCPPERHQAESALCSPLGPKAKELGEPSKLLSDS